MFTKVLAKFAVGTGLLLGIGFGTQATVGTPVAHAATPVCQGRTYTPTAGYGSVASSSEINCNGNQKEIWIEAFLSGPTGFYRASRRCYNVSSCRATASAPFAHGGWSGNGQGEATGYDLLKWTSSWSGGGSVTY